MHTPQPIAQHQLNNDKNKATPLISQEAYDETIIENQECFDLSADEAMEETLLQFAKQCSISVELLRDGKFTPTEHLLLTHPDSEIGRSERNIRQKFTNDLECLDALVQKDGSVVISLGERGKWCKAIDALKEVIRYTQHQSAVENLTDGGVLHMNPNMYLSLMDSQGGIYSLMSLLGATTTTKDSTCEEEEEALLMDVLGYTMDCLICVISGSLLLRDGFVAFERLLTLLDQCSTQPTSTSSNFAQLLPRVLKLAHASCLKCEPNKLSCVQSQCLSNNNHNHNNDKRKGGIALLLSTLQSVSTPCTSDNSNASIKGCKLISILCRYDDFRVEMSLAHEFAMDFYRGGIIPILHRIASFALLTKHNEEYNLVLASASMAAIRVLSISDEIIQNFIAVGLLPLIRSSLQISTSNNNNNNNNPPIQLMIMTMGTIRNICGNDEIKTTLCTDQYTLPTLLSIMSTHLSNSSNYSFRYGFKIG